MLGPIGALMSTVHMNYISCMVSPGTIRFSEQYGIAYAVEVSILLSGGVHLRQVFFLVQIYLGLHICLKTTETEYVWMWTPDIVSVSPSIRDRYPMVVEWLDYASRYLAIYVQRGSLTNDCWSCTLLQYLS